MKIKILFLDPVVVEMKSKIWSLCEENQPIVRAHNLMSGVSSNSPKTHERDNWKNIEEIGPSIKNRTYGKIRPLKEL